MASHSLEVRLNNSFYRVSVSTVNCSDVYDYKRAIKKALSPELDSYSYDHLALCQPDGTTKIPVETLVGDLKEDPCKPMVVLVKTANDESGETSLRRALTHEERVRNTSVTNFFDKVACVLARSYDFKWEYADFPTIGDVLLACDTNDWKHRMHDGSDEVLIRSDALPDVFDHDEWVFIRERHLETDTRIHGGEDDEFMHELLLYFEGFDFDRRYANGGCDLEGSTDCESELDG